MVIIHCKHKTFISGTVNSAACYGLKDYFLVDVIQQICLDCEHNAV
jgi:hypothetical protein